MAFDLTAFTAYVDESSTEFLVDSLTGAKTASLANKQSGIKSSADLHIFETDAIFQAGGSCSRTASGTTTLSKRNLTVGDIAIHEDICPKDLEAYWTQIMLNAGSTYETVPFEQVWLNRKSEVIAKQLETALWQGNTSSGNANLSRFDGLNKLIDAEGTVVAADNSGSLAINTTNIRTIMQDIYDSIPAQLLDKDDLVFLCGYDTFRIYQNKLASDNLYHYTGEADAFEMMVENSGIKLIAVHGLDGTDRIYATRKSNIYVGMDLEGEEDNAEVWYSKDDRVVKFSVEFKYGVQIAFPDEIVKFVGA